MATVNMNCVEFYNPNPKPALKASHAQLTKSVLNKHRLPLQPSRSPPAMSAGDVQDNDSLDDSQSLQELLCPPQNRDIPQLPHQNHNPLYISKRQLIDEGRLLTDATTPNPAYVPGNTQKEPLIIEDNSDDESDNEAEAGVASSDLLASIANQYASEYGLATQDTASTPNSLSGSSTPRDSEYLDADCFSKQRPSFAELDLTFPVQARRRPPNCSEPAETTGQDQIHQGVEKAIVDEIRPSHYSPLHERAGGSCDPSSVFNIEDELRQTSEEAEGSPPSSAPHSQYNQINQESQNNTDVRGISSEERLWEKTVEQQHRQQKEQEDEDEDEDEDDTEAISCCQQIKESLRNQPVEDETMAPLSQGRERSIKSYRKDNDDNEDNEDYEDEDEDEDVRPPRRRKRRHIESDVTDTATRKNVHTRSSTIAQAQTCTTQGSTVSRSSSADAESILGADYQEYPLQGFFKCVRIGRETTYNLEFRLLDLPDSSRPSIGLHISNSTSSGESVGGSAHPRVCASHGKRSRALQKQRKRPPLRERIVSRPGRHSTYSEDDDELLIQLKEDDKLPWDEIAKYFPERTKGSLQVHYTTKLKNRSQTSMCKKRKITNSAKESGERYPSRFSMDLLDPQLQDALPSSTSILPATADSTEDAHGSILSTTPGNIKGAEVQPLRSSQGVESNLVAIDATEGRWEVEALLAKSKVGNVIWYLVKWAGFRNEDNTWQKRDDISSDLINDFEASYRGNYLGVQLLKKRERRGKIEYFVEWKGRPAIENSWEKEVTINRERILEFEAK